MRRVIAALTGMLALGAAGGCGIPATGVVEAGEAPTWVSKGIRLYFVTDDGLQAVSRPDIEVDSLDAALKLLHAGPTTAEQTRGGLTTLVHDGLPISASGNGKKGAVGLGEAKIGPEQTGLLGQLVCTTARTQSVLEDGIRPDDVQVTLGDGPGALGPYRCSYFLKNR
ncbi:hypothetical protein P8605_46545 [Streptomyces sp. T-3]|nr:hypothetical protein [Streptomyces sp. T-3]